MPKMRERTPRRVLRSAPAPYVFPEPVGPTSSRLSRGAIPRASSLCRWRCSRRTRSSLVASSSVRTMSARRVSGYVTERMPSSSSRGVAIGVGAWLREVGAGKSGRTVRLSWHDPIKHTGREWRREGPEPPAGDPSPMTRQREQSHRPRKRTHRVHLPGVCSH